MSFVLFQADVEWVARLRSRKMTGLGWVALDWVGSVQTDVESIGKRQDQSNPTRSSDLTGTRPK
eukprot:3469449-Lingulodinium_polyedra.AAC.1